MEVVELLIVQLAVRVLAIQGGSSQSPTIVPPKVLQEVRSLATQRDWLQMSGLVSVVVLLIRLGNCLFWASRVGCSQKSRVVTRISILLVPPLVELRVPVVFLLVTFGE